MNAIIVFLSVLFISLVGFSIIRGFHLLNKSDILLAVGASYGLGVGLIGMQLYLYFRLNIPWDRESVLLPWIIIMGVLILQRKKRTIRLPGMPVLTKIETLLIVGILISICYVVFEALLRPVVAWDAWSVWLLYPKMFFIDNGISLDTLRYTFSGYPMTISLLGSFVYIVLGNIDDTAVLLTSAAFYIFLLISFFAVLRKRYSISFALVFTFLLATTQNFVRHGGRLEAGLADLPLGYFAFLSVIFLFMYFKKKSVKALIIFIIFLGITSLIKYEGIPLAFLISICSFFFIVKQRIFRHILILALWIIPVFFWQLDRRLTGLENTYFTSAHPIEISINKSVNAFVGTFSELINIRSWNLLWITYFFALVVCRIKKNRDEAILHFIIICQLSLYLVMYNVTYGNSPESSIQRLLMHIAPLGFYSLAICINKLIPDIKKLLNNNRMKVIP